MEFFDFMYQIIKDVTGLIIILGLLLFIVSFVKISGKIEINDPKDRNIMRAIGAILLLIAFSGLIYPKAVTVQGEITYWDGKPADGIRVEIGNISTTSNGDGWYELHNVPRGANFIDFIFPNYAIREELNIPAYSLLSKNMPPMEGSIVYFTLEGNVKDESGDPFVLKDEFGNSLNTVVVRVGNISAPVLEGKYILNKIPIYPNARNYIGVYTIDNRMLLRSELRFSEGETEKKYKNYDMVIDLGKTIEVFGTVKRYCGLDKLPAPIIGATIEMGGRINLTDEDGKYLITDVPRDTAVYKIKLISGKEKQGEIMPPLKDLPLSEKKARRPLIISI